MYAEQRAITALDRLPKANKDDWLRRATSDLDKARDAYKAAVVELARAREQLGDEATLVSYLRYGQQTQPLAAALRQPLSDGSVRAFDFTQLIDVMLDEANTVEEKAALDPNRPVPEPQFHRMHTA